MTTNAERVHREFGQSLWYDNLERGLLRSGAFQALLDAGVRGCTSNPTIFEKAIRSSTEYEPALRRLVAAGTQLRAFPRPVMEACMKATFELYEEVAAKNDKFRAVYEPWKKFRDEQYLWFRVAEQTLDNFNFTAKS